MLSDYIEERYGGTIRKLEEQLIKSDEQHEKELQEKDKTIQEKNETIQEKDDEIEKYKKLLKDNGIKYD